MIRTLAIAFALVSASGAQSVNNGSHSVSASQQKSPVYIIFERTTTQTLADGTHIHHVTHERFFRDDEGRTRVENDINAPGSNKRRVMIVVQDVVANIVYTWTEGEGAQPVYTRLEVLPHRSPPNTALRPAPMPPQDMSATPPEALASIRPHTTRERLGIWNIKGFPCEASRISTIYPIDSVGNDRPITVTNESCISREFGRSLSDRIEDPRTGINALMVVSIERTDPDLPFFQPPDGYTERERNPIPRP